MTGLTAGIGHKPGLVALSPKFHGLLSDSTKSAFLQSHFSLAHELGVVKPRQPLCDLNGGHLYERVLLSRRDPASCVVRRRNSQRAGETCTFVWGAGSCTGIAVAKNELPLKTLPVKPDSFRIPTPASMIVFPCTRLLFP